MECASYLFRSTSQYGILNLDMAIATMREPCHERPPPSFERNRLICLKNSFAHNLFNTLDSRLSLDVCEQIAVGFAKERAVQVIRDAWLQAENFRPGSLLMTIGPDTALWAQYIQFDREKDRYINSLSYRSRGGDEVKIFERKDGTPLNIFRNEYKYYMWSRYGTPWSTPPVHIKPVLKPLTGLFKDSHFNIVRAVDWNKPGIKGYSFYLRYDIVLRIIPYDGSKPVDYELRGRWHREYSWLYLPMDDDERVSEFWIRRYVKRRGPAATLIVSHHTLQNAEKASSDLDTSDPYKQGT
jgi:hypothetical protein